MLVSQLYLVAVIEILLLVLLKNPNYFNASDLLIKLMTCLLFFPFGNFSRLCCRKVILTLKLHVYSFWKKDPMVILNENRLSAGILFLWNKMRKQNQSYIKQVPQSKGSGFVLSNVVEGSTHCMYFEGNCFRSGLV